MLSSGNTTAVRLLWPPDPPPAAGYLCSGRGGLLCDASLTARAWSLVRPSPDPRTQHVSLSASAHCNMAPVQRCRGAQSLRYRLVLAHISGRTLRCACFARITHPPGGSEREYSRS